MRPTPFRLTLAASIAIGLIGYAGEQASAVSVVSLDTERPTLGSSVASGKYSTPAGLLFAVGPITESTAAVAATAAVLNFLARRGPVPLGGPKPHSFWFDPHY